MSSRLYRRAALERLQSPEHLDELMQVNRPGSWVALATLLALVAFAIGWSVLGTIPTKVQAQGILIRTGGLSSILSLGAGPLAEVLVKEGDQVEENQIVARIEQPELARQVENLRAGLAELRDQHRQLTEFNKQDATLQADTEVLRRQQLEASITFAQQQIANLKEQLANDETLLERGLMTRLAVMQTRTSIFNAEDQAERARNELKQLSVADLTTRASREREIGRSQIAMSDTQRRMELLEQQLERQSVVRSPYAGRVVEVNVRPGDVVPAGAALASLQTSDSDTGLQALIYVPSNDGKRVEAGMEVQISPSSAPREEYGFIRGQVNYVSQFPSTPEAMLRVLGNSRLAETLAGQGAPFAVYAELTRHPGPNGGFIWSSPKGEALSVNSGTPCMATVTVENRRPIDLVIPLLRQYIGL